MADSPISFRPDDSHRQLIEVLRATEGMSPTAIIKHGLDLMAAVNSHRQLIAELRSTDGMSPAAIIKRGLDLMAAVNVPTKAPMYARSVEDSDVDAAVEEATKLACDRLDELFRAEGAPEVRGISSNFQGLLAEHLRAMLTGLEYAQKTHCTPLLPLLARWDSFGRNLYPKGPQQGITLMRPATKIGDTDTFFSVGRMVELKDIDVGDLYTDSEPAIKDYLAWLLDRGESPQDHPARLVVIDFSQDALIALAR